MGSILQLLHQVAGLVLDNELLNWKANQRMSTFTPSNFESHSLNKIQHWYVISHLLEGRRCGCVGSAFSTLRLFPCWS